MPNRTIYWRTDTVERAKRFKATLRAIGATIMRPVYHAGLLTHYEPDNT